MSGSNIAPSPLRHGITFEDRRDTFNGPHVYCMACNPYSACFNFPRINLIIAGACLIYLLYYKTIFVGHGITFEDRRDTFNGPHVYCMACNPYSACFNFPRINLIIAGACLIYLLYYKTIFVGHGITFEDRRDTFNGPHVYCMACNPYSACFNFPRINSIIAGSCIIYLLYYRTIFF